MYRQLLTVYLFTMFFLVTGCSVSIKLHPALHCQDSTYLCYEKF